MAPETTVRNFDLNIEKILEGWETCHALREIIANALDEQVLSNTKDVVIAENHGSWHIRDFGRGLKYEHLTQKENPEKLRKSSVVIGKFGVGLKDALATLNRRGIDVRICSKFGEITLGKLAKHDFSDVKTLHAIVHRPENQAFVGTEVKVRGVTKKDVTTAKNFFLKFSDETVLDETPYGQILLRDSDRKARIYVTGMLVAEEEDFVFSYNITSLTATMRKALNRERTNVGRTAYSERVKRMLLASEADTVADTLAADLEKMEAGTNHDEVNWTDVAVHACQILNASKKVIFVTASELLQHKSVIDLAKSDGLKVITVPNKLRDALGGLCDLQGNPVRDLSVYESEWEQSFEFKFVKPEQLTKQEMNVFRQRHAIAKLIGGMPKRVNKIKISETMRPDFHTGHVTQGLWDPVTGSIIVLRTQLKSSDRFAGTFLHEIAHAKTGFDDVTREFEGELTQMLGRVAAFRL